MSFSSQPEQAAGESPKVDDGSDNESSSETVSSCDSIEVTLLQRTEVFVYKVPIRPPQGHRAESWAACIWRGSLKIVGKGNTLFVRLIDLLTDELFAQCPLTDATSDTAVERTIDSSRYFVLRLHDGKTEHAFVGIGFENRNEAFDFNVTISDFFRRIRAESEHERSTKNAKTPTKDFSLSKGETLRIKIKGLAKPKHYKQSALDEPDTNNNIQLLLPPPPAFSNNISKKKKDRAASDSRSPEPSDLDFNDFQTA